MLATRLLGQRRKPIPPPGNDHKRMSPPGKPKRDLGPDAGRGPGDKRPPLPGSVTQSDRTAAVAVMVPK